MSSADGDMEAWMPPWEDGGRELDEWAEDEETELDRE